jgi:hypothetical protein
MPKESNCQCVVCQVEQNLLDSLSTQTARIHFQVLAGKYPILNHFDSPVALIAQLHNHQEVEIANHIACDATLHALIDSVADGAAEELGQQLLLVAYTPAIHKAYREVCQKFPGLSPEDVAQQATLSLLETATSPEMQCLNGHLPAALAKRFRRRLFRWAIGETRQSLPLQKMIADPAEPSTSRFEHTVTLETIMQQANRDGLLSDSERQLLFKFKWEGCEANELVGMNVGDTTNAVQMRLKRIIKRLRRAFKDTQPDSAGRSECSESKNFSTEATILSDAMGIRKCGKEFSTGSSARSATVRTHDPAVSTAIEMRLGCEKKRQILAEIYG